MVHRKRRELMLGAVLVLGQLAHAQMYGDVTLDPKTYVSPSGQVRLFVDPSQPSGAGPATYRCTRGGVELWSCQRSYTLWEAEVTDDGLVAGYAFAAGYEGGDDDALTIALIAPDGKARLEEHSKREGTLSDIGSPDPMVTDLFLDPENDRFVVRARLGGVFGAESWWPYSLSTGAPGRKQDPRAGFPADERIDWIAEIRVIPGTSLVLVRWDWSDYGEDQHGAVFTLLDSEAKVVWRMDWPADYTVAGDDEATDKIRDEIREQSVILAVEPKRFTLRTVATNERVTFNVEHVTGAREGWDVREVSRAPFTSEKSAATVSGKPTDTAEPATLALKHLGSIALGSAAPSSPIRDVMTFALDGLGRPGFLRRTGERYDFVRVDREGENAVEIPLPTAPKGEWWSFDLAWTERERWVVTGSTSDEAPKHAWWLDASARTVVPIEDFAGPTIESLASTPDGGFVVLGTTQYRSGYFTSDLVAFGRDGKKLFALGGDQGDPRDPKTLFAPQALTVLASGEIVILSNIQDTLQFFSGTGEFLRVVDLKQAWGREPNYPAGLHLDTDGGLIVRDSGGNPSNVRIDASGKIRSGFDPHYPDGRSFNTRGDVQVATDGSLWTSDEHALLGLDRDGAVQRVLGSAPDTTVLGKIAALTIGPEDRIYAADSRTAAVHVFQSSGELLHICQADPGDVSGELGLVSLTVTDTGNVFLGSLQFSGDGKRLGKNKLDVEGMAPERYAQPGGAGRMWGVGYKSLGLFGTDGKAVRKIERAPDGTWLRDMGRAGVAPDGSIALATSTGFSGGVPGIHIYSASGDPVRTITPPRDMATWANFAFDGERIAIGVQRQEQPGAVVMMDAQGHAIGTFTPEGTTSFWQPFFAAKGKELWLFDGEHKIERFAMP